MSKKKSDYTVTVSCYKQKVVGVGKTIVDALKDIHLSNIRGRVIISVEHDGKTKERVMRPQLVSRAYTLRGLTQDVALKILATSLV